MAIHGSATPVRDGDSKAVGACLLFRGATQRTGDEPWGAPDHGSTSRMEILGRLTAAVAQKFSSLLEASRGRVRAARLANRLLEFGQRQPAPPCDLDLNELISGLDDLLQCALGGEIGLLMALGPGAGRRQGRCRPDRAAPDAFGHLRARKRLSGPVFDRDFHRDERRSTDDGYAMITVTLPRGGHGAALSLPALDEIWPVCGRNAALQRSRRGEDLCARACLILPTTHIRPFGRGLFHVLHHFRQIVLIHSHFGIEVAGVAMRFALPEIECAVIIRICSCLHEVLH